MIEPDVHNVLWYQFEKTPQLVAAGAAAARAALPKIKAALAGELVRHPRRRQTDRFAERI
jgi:hypothetical protein